MPKTTYAVNNHVNGVVALQPDQHQARAGEGDAGNQQGNPGSPHADNSSGDRRDQHGHGRHRQRVDPGLERRESTHVLQVERVEEEKATERGEGRDGDDGG